MEKLSNYTEVFNVAIDKNKDDLRTASLETPVLYSKFANYLAKETYTLKKLIAFKESLDHKKYMFYCGYLDQELYIRENFNQKLTKTEAIMYAKSDKEVIQHGLKISEQELVVELLSGFLGVIRYRHSSIKNALDYEMFLAGKL